MTRDIIDINDFTILVETSNAQQTSIDVCSFDEPIIAVAFYGEGNVDLSVNYGDKQKAFNHTKGLALSFYADEQVAFSHTVSVSEFTKWLEPMLKLPGFNFSFRDKAAYEFLYFSKNNSHPVFEHSGLDRLPKPETLSFSS